MSDPIVDTISAFGFTLNTDNFLEIVCESIDEEIERRQALASDLIRSVVEYNNRKHLMMVKYNPRKFGKEFMDGNIQANGHVQSTCDQTFVAPPGCTSDSECGIENCPNSGTQWRRYKKLDMVICQAHRQRLTASGRYIKQTPKKLDTIHIISVKKHKKPVCAIASRDGKYFFVRCRESELEIYSQSDVTFLG